jgi:predicted RNA-binding protein with RPS1 domain
MQEAPAAGDIAPGTVHTIKPFGVFVQLEGYRRHCLVHHTQVRAPCTTHR